MAEFGPDLAAAVAAARALGPVRLPEELLAAAATLTPEQLTADLVAALAVDLGMGGKPGTEEGPPVPDRMAEVNTLLNTAPPPLREKLLLEFLSLLQQPTY